jgi:tRNA(His) guanylyltransferase
VCRFTRDHGFEKPHDASGLALMNAAAKETMKEFPGDLRLAFGESDEYSFVFDKNTKLYQRRASKLVSLVVSCFTGNYVRLWQEYFPRMPLSRVPLFDGRAVAYPSLKTLRDYLSWRQADTHINCQYNTCYWLLMKEMQDREAVQKVLQGTLTADKNELLYQRGVNYNDIPEMYRKGSTIIWVYEDGLGQEGKRKRGKKELKVFHEDIIRDRFWDTYPHVLLKE